MKFNCKQQLVFVGKHISNVVVQCVAVFYSHLFVFDLSKKYRILNLLSSCMSNILSSFRDF